MQGEYVTAFLNQSAIFVGSVVGFLNVFVRNGRDRSLRASFLPLRYHLWFIIGIGLALQVFFFILTMIMVLKTIHVLPFPWFSRLC